MKAIKKHNKMLFSMSNWLGSRRELKNINNIRPKASKKYGSSSSNSSSNNYDSYISSDSEWYKKRHPAERKDMKNLDHLVTNNINNKDQCNEAIGYEPNFDNKFSLSSGTKDPLAVVTVSLRGGKKHRATIIDVLKCLWDSGATEITI